MTIVDIRGPVTGGIDTHADVHVAAVVDRNGGLLGVEAFPTTPAGFRALFDWLATHGDLERVGVEGTGSYGAGVKRFLQSQAVIVIEVDRPNRQERRRHGKSEEHYTSVVIARAIADWCCFNEVETVFIDPGSPWQNAWIESFNGRLRDEFLNGWQFDSLLEAQVLVEDWRIDYNINRPHSAHGDLTPAEFAQAWTTRNQPVLA